MSDFSQWYNAKSFSKILKLNMEFIKGNLSSTPYHYGPIYDMNVTDLLYLHKNGILTTNGQSNECYYTQKHSMEQKSYLNGFTYKRNLKFLLNFLYQNKHLFEYKIYDISNDIGYISGIKDPIKKLSTLGDRNTNTHKDIDIYYSFVNGKYITRHKYGDTQWKETTRCNMDFYPIEYEFFLEQIPVSLINFSITTVHPCTVNVDKYLADYIKKYKTVKKE